MRSWLSPPRYTALALMATRTLPPPAVVKWVCTQRQTLLVRACHCFPVVLRGVWTAWENWVVGLVLRAGRNP